MLNFAAIFRHYFFLIVILMSFSSCIRTSVPIDVPPIIPSCVRLRSTTLNISASAGTKITSERSMSPTASAAKIYLLSKNFFVNRTGLSDLQLNPWISLERHMLANAMELAVAASVFSPKRKQSVAAAAIIIPSEKMLRMNCPVRIDWFTGRGFSFMTSCVCGSSPRAIAGSESVRRFINRR